MISGLVPRYSQRIAGLFRMYSPTLRLRHAPPCFIGENEAATLAPDWTFPDERNRHGLRAGAFYVRLEMSSQVLWVASSASLIRLRD